MLFAINMKCSVQSYRSLPSNGRAEYSSKNNTLAEVCCKHRGLAKNPL